MSQYILGIIPTLDGLRIDPCIPDTLKSYHCERIYRGALYHIEIDNTAGVQHGVVSMTVNGKKADGTLIPQQDACREYQVKVVMG